MTGIMRRLAKLFHPASSRCLIAPLDQGVFDGIIPGMADMPALLATLSGRPVQGVILNKGMARGYAGSIPLHTSLIIQLSAGTKHCLPPYARGLATSALEAMRLGADAVAVQVNIGNDLEDRMLADFGAVLDEAHGLGLPVLALIHPKGGHIVNELDATLVAHCIRLAAELGADVTGVPFSGDAPSFAKAVAASPTPVIVTGGPKQSDFDGMLAMLALALECGAAGSCVGRNVFARPQPEQALEQVIAVVHGHGPDGE